MEKNFLKPIMSYNNGHDKRLVDKITLIGNDPVRESMLYNILTFIANDNIDEVIRKVIEEEWQSYYSCNKKISYSVASAYSYDILTNICDDSDLITIISYCRINQKLPKDNFNDCEAAEKYFNQELF